MQKIYTAGNRSFDADACGVSWLGQLYINIIGQDFAGLLPVFSDPAQTRELRWVDDGRTITYTGYSELVGMQKDLRNGWVQICLVVPEGGNV